MDNEAKVSISLREGKIEICGSESFVKEQLDRFKELIDGKLSALPAMPLPPMTPPPANSSTGASLQNPPQGSTYPNVIAIEEDDIRILKAIPGKTKAEKTVNAALLYLIGIELKGQSSATFSKIRDICKHHSCLDAPNFSKAIKGAKELFIVSGSGKSQTAKLTHPGSKKANQLATDLNAQ